MSSIITEQEAINLIERELSLQEIATRGPRMYATILRGLQRIRHIDPEKAEGRRDYVLTDNISEARLSMPQEIQWTVYNLQRYKSHHNSKRSLVNTVSSVIGFTASFGLVAQNHADDVSLYAVAGLLGLSAVVLQFRGFFYTARWIHNKLQQKSDERFARLLNQRESKLVDYIFMNDRFSSGSTV